MRSTQLFHKVFTVLGLILCVGIAYFLISNISNDTLRMFAEQNKFVGALLFVGLLFGTTVIAPLTSLPLVPMVAMYLGSFVTGVACFVGWTLGAIVAFLVGRHLGQPFVAKYIGMEKIRKYEKYIPPETSFMFIVALRMCVPVDLLSYGLGLLSTISFRTYTLATMLGIFWFSFAFAYGGVALMNRDYVLLASIGVASVLILGFSWIYVRRKIGSKGQE